MSERQEKLSWYRTLKRNNQTKQDNTKHYQRKKKKEKREMELIKINKDEK
jgi:alkylated DNA nucleotide flippase Atl1